MEQLLGELEEVLEKDRIRQKEMLKDHTTFRIGGPADLYLLPDRKELPAVIEILRRHEIPVTVIGNGSNLLVADAGIRGAVIEIGSPMSEVSVDGALVTAQAGALLSKAAHEAYKNSLSGMEFAAGIPGSVGGAIVMNAGAYGGEMKDIVSSVKVLSREGEILTLSKEQMEFSYRGSAVLKNDYVVLEATFLLKKAKQEQILKRMEELRERRQEKQPLTYPSAGSTFKRPEGYFAGKLIMDAGLSGYSAGGAMVSKKHCGFVVNQGGATAADVLAVIRHVQRTVNEQFHVELETEVKMLGEFETREG